VHPLWIWRHPRVALAAGRCIGRTDLSLDLRRARRLARQVRAVVRRESLPREVWTSPLKRCAQVGQALARIGLRHRVDERLLELDFGRWDGLGWGEIDHAEVAAWEADLLHNAPGGGESLERLMGRVRSFLAETSEPRLVIGHAGWMQALMLLDGLPPTADRWPPPPAHGSLLRWTLDTERIPSHYAMLRSASRS
jgi:alpha-ribazole phosphatase